MSVSHPLLKQLKGYASKLLNECSQPISDSDPTLKGFCECYEEILSKGLTPYETLLLILNPDCWHWLRNLGDEKCGVPYSYLSSVEEVLSNPRVETNRGKVRLLIRTCLVKKCLHFPIQYLVNEERCCLLYERRSVLGDPILASVLTSVLLCLSTIPFNLELENAHFLDTTWQLPTLVSFTFVPAKRLGLSIMFVEGKAVITDILENSVAAENNEIEVGDILDSINGRVVNKKCQGSLAKLVRKMSKHPINIAFIKSRIGRQPYPPVLHYWYQAGLDPTVICAETNLDCEKKEEPAITDDMKGVTYIGSVYTGSQGDLRQIQAAFHSLPEGQDPLPVSIECQHLGIKVISLPTQEVLIEHNYMDISACGCSQSSPHFGFIAGEKPIGDNKKRFTCYVFKSSEPTVVTSFLDTVGQGFRRTLYTV